MEPIPRMRTVAALPGCPLLAMVCTPDTWPANAFVTLETERSASLSAFTVDAEPVNDDFLAVP